MNTRKPKKRTRKKDAQNNNTRVTVPKTPVGCTRTQRVRDAAEVLELLYEPNNEAELNVVWIQAYAWCALKAGLGHDPVRIGYYMSDLSAKLGLQDYPCPADFGRITKQIFNDLQFIEPNQVAGKN